METSIEARVADLELQVRDLMLTLETIAKILPVQEAERLMEAGADEDYRGPLQKLLTGGVKEREDRTL